MKSTNWKEIAELEGIAAIVVSLIFVGLQLRQEQEIAIVGTRADVTEAMIGIASALSGNGDIWKKGLDGSPMPDAERIEFLALVEAVEDHLFTLWISWDRLGPRDPDSAVQRYAYALYSHPGLRQAWEQSRDYAREEDSAFKVPSVRSGFFASVDKYLAELDSEEPPISDEKNYVFW